MSAFIHPAVAFGWQYLCALMMRLCASPSSHALDGFAESGQILSGRYVNLSVNSSPERATILKDGVTGLM